MKNPEIENKVTKRKIVSCVAELYNLNGFLSPVIILGKILIQNLWQLKIDWDEVVTEEIESKWKQYWKEIKLLEQFRIDRWIGSSSDIRIEVHGFADASTIVYGAAIYIRVEQLNGKILQATY